MQDRNPWAARETEAPEEPTIHRLEGFSKETAWFNQNWEDLLCRYGNQWVAVSGQQVVVADSDPERDLERLAELKLLALVESGCVCQV